MSRKNYIKREKFTLHIIIVSTSVHDKEIPDVRALVGNYTWYVKDICIIENKFYINIYINYFIYIILYCYYIYCYIIIYIIYIK